MKEAEDTKVDRSAPTVLTQKQALGSYMGSRVTTTKERASRGVGGNGSSYRYLKVISDFAGRNEGTPATCARMIERMGEKLLLPRVVRLEAASIAKRLLALPRPHRRVTIAAVSAYALIAACKLEGVTSVSVREVIEAHAALGGRVTSSSIIQLTLESPVRTYARRAEDYLSRVVARLSLNQRLGQELARVGVGQTAFSGSLRETASELLGLVSSESRAGRRPSALAASAIYSAEQVLSRLEKRKRRLTQRELAECGDTAEYTIREQCARIFAPAVESLVRRKTLHPLLQEVR